MKIEGLYTAIVTPFTKKGELNEEGLRRNIAFQMENRVDGLVPVGTTGESATLTEEEHKKVIDIAIDEARGKVRVFAGTGSNNTKEAVEYTKYARDAGADAALMITPYYNKPTQEGVYQHYRKIAQEVDIPIILYTVPGRTMVNIEPETTKRLSGIPNIVGIKDASGSLDQITKEIMACGKDFTILSGEDSLNLPIMCLGGRGAISVVSNVAPRQMGSLIRSALEGNYAKARKIHYELYPLCKTLFIETNPSPVKAAMNLMGLAAGEPRLPLVPVKKENEEKIRKALEELKLV
ncbi:MAG: 4-hydroxy-tetrahydrodipicolinate synthase [Candidatus Altiarchaeota archaeon]|nr:4-hydroxy-tetrahydrodipicolinate synthase [Candidatus Altiarchaeota archaeon]